MDCLPSLMGSEDHKGRAPRARNYVERVIRTYRKFRGLGSMLRIISGSGSVPDLHIDSVRVKPRDFP
jgi:hypothetical protein